MDVEKDKRLRCKFCFISPIKSEGKMKYQCDCHVNGLGNVQYNISAEDCETCDKFKSRYIEYPITVNKINIEDFNFNDPMRQSDVGKMVSVRPCAEQYQWKTYIGVFLGYIPMNPRISWNYRTQELNIGPIHNPAIFVPELRKIIFGAESWWSIIESEDDFKEISDELINNQWYVKALHAMIGDTNKKGSNNDGK